MLRISSIYATTHYPHLQPINIWTSIGSKRSIYETAIELPIIQPRSLQLASWSAIATLALNYSTIEVDDCSNEAIFNSYLFKRGTSKHEHYNWRCMRTCAYFAGSIALTSASTFLVHISGYGRLISDSQLYFGMAFLMGICWFKLTTWKYPEKPIARHVVWIVSCVADGALKASSPAVFSKGLQLLSSSRLYSYLATFAFTGVAFYWLDCLCLKDHYNASNRWILTISITTSIVLEAVFGASASVLGKAAHFTAILSRIVCNHLFIIWHTYQIKCKAEGALMGNNIEYDPIKEAYALVLRTEGNVNLLSYYLQYLP